MEYNTEKNVADIKRLLEVIIYDTKTVLEKLQLSATDAELDYMWDICDTISDTAEEARRLIGKMYDEREDMRTEGE